MGYSIISALLIFNLLVLNCFQHDLLAKQVKTLISEDRRVQHIMACMLLFVIILVLTRMSIEKSLLYTVLGYFLFILTTKLDIQFNIIVFGLLLAGFLYECTIVQKEEQVEKDPVLSQEDKQNVLTKFTTNKVSLAIGTIIFTVVGTYLYMTRKQIQYGGSFSYQKYFLD